MQPVFCFETSLFVAVSSLDFGESTHFSAQQRRTKYQQGCRGYRGLYFKKKRKKVLSPASPASLLNFLSHHER
jgi:hypothetical protein